MARPRKEIDVEQFKKLCSLQCTLSEIASWFDCSEDTIERWCKRTFKENFAETYKKSCGKGKISLRRAQFKAAEGGNATLLVWLGKQWLGQRDVPDDHTEDLEDKSDALSRSLEELADDLESDSV